MINWLKETVSIARIAFITEREFLMMDLAVLSDAFKKIRVDRREAKREAEEMERELGRRSLMLVR